MIKNILLGKGGKVAKKKIFWKILMGEVKIWKNVKKKFLRKK